MRAGIIAVAGLVFLAGSAAYGQTDNAPGKTATGRKVGGVPSDALGLCKDGTYVSTGSKQSACSRHGGMKIWYPDGPEHPTAADYAEPAAGRTATGRNVGGVPSDALGLCKDGTYVSTGMKDTACSAHGGMKIWYPDGPEHPTAADYAEPAAGKTATGRKVGGVPSDALGLCKDGTYVSTGTKDNACSAHGGMKIWYPDGTPNN